MTGGHAALAIMQAAQALDCGPDRPVPLDALREYVKKSGSLSEIFDLGVTVAINSGWLTLRYEASLATILVRTSKFSLSGGRNAIVAGI